MGPTVYLVIGCEYENQHTVGIYTTLPLAQAAVVAHDAHHAYRGAIKPGPSGKRYLIDGATITLIPWDEPFSCRGGGPCGWPEGHRGPGGMAPPTEDADPAPTPHAEKPRRRRPSAGD